MASRSVRENTQPQVRWDEYGRDRLEAMERDPGAFSITTYPEAQMPFMQGLVTALGPVRGKRILEVGCGYGELSVYLAKQGAVVAAFDIGSTLIEAARELARINEVSVDFRTADATSVPWPSGSSDIVVAVGVLHHLSESDLAVAVREAHRVLGEGGMALFCEPVENSRAFSLLQDLVPVGTPGSADYRPSRLRRKAWREFVAAQDQRSPTTRELISAGHGLFTSVDVAAYGLLSRLEAAPS